MLRQINFYSVCLAFGFSYLLIRAGMCCISNTNFRASSERDGWPDINKLLENERSKIRQELWNLNFSVTDTHHAAAMMKDADRQPEPQQSLIISTWRSGTTFLGEILNAIPGNFYHFEPLINYGTMQIRGLPYSTKALNTVKRKLKCKFDGLNEYIEYADQIFQSSQNTRLWEHCNKKVKLCFDAGFTEKFCKLFPFQTMKIVRLRLHLVEDIITDKELNVKVVLLIRDPRGVMQSRQHCTFCRLFPDCSNPKMLCADMISDYLAAANIIKQYPQRLMVLRYEELALHPYTTAHHILLKFLGLGMVLAINEFLDTHTHTNKEYDSTYKVSHEVPFKWKMLSNFSFVEYIQNACKDAMTLWGYRLAYNASHMTSKEFNPLEKYVL